MAKAPVPGRAKTRLVPPLSPEAAAALGGAFLRDITENIALAARDVPIQGCVAYAPAGAEPLFAGTLARGTNMLLADGSAAMPPGLRGLGRALLHAMQASLAQGFRAACLLNADSPTLPTAFLRRAAALLLQANPDRVVLGPAEDGGYYLVGARAAHAHLFTDIDWSTAEVAAQTRARARESGLDLIELPTWYDVDDRASLRRLLCELDDAGRLPAEPVPYSAPATIACVRRFGLHDLLATSE